MRVRVRACLCVCERDRESVKRRIPPFSRIHGFKVTCDLCVIMDTCWLALSVHLGQERRRKEERTHPSAHMHPRTHIHVGTFVWQCQIVSDCSANDGHLHVNSRSSYPWLPLMRNARCSAKFDNLTLGRGCVSMCMDLVWLRCVLCLCSYCLLCVGGNCILDLWKDYDGFVRLWFKTAMLGGLVVWTSNQCLGIIG